jgi:hypothetical protein
MKTAEDRSRCDDSEALGHFRGRGIFVVRIGGGQLKFSFDFIISLRSASERAERSTLSERNGPACGTGAQVAGWT